MNSSFPFYESLKYKLSLSLTLAIFFYIFIVFFLPFGVDNYNPNHEYTLSFFLEIFFFFVPLLTFTLVNEIILRPLFFTHATLIRVIIWSIWTLLLLSTVTFFAYNILGSWHDFNLSSYLEFLPQVSSVLIFPLVGTFFFFKYKSLQDQIEHILTAKESFLDESQLVEFKGQGSKDQITLSLSNFLYGKAQDNYMELYYVEKEQLKKFLMRTSLTKLLESVNDQVIVRCHRSYMINLLHVSAVKGSSHNLTLNIEPFDTSIPVSKSYQKTTIESLREIKNFG